MSVIINSSSSSSSASPPWEVLVLISQHLDPKTLAMSSCVSKAWSTAMSADHLWRPICAAEFPSLAPVTAVSLRRLYSLGRAAAAARRRQAPSKPRLALADLAFAVTVTAAGSGATLVSAFEPCAELAADPNGVFVFHVNQSAVKDEVGFSGAEATAVRVAWSVVLREWRGVFTMMECEGKVGVAAAAAAEGWFSAELPVPGCCAGAASAGSGIVADLKLRLGGGERVVVEKVSVGILSVVNWRYVTVEDALRYLQHFLLPPLQP